VLTLVRVPVDSIDRFSVLIRSAFGMCFFLQEQIISVVYLFEW